MIYLRLATFAASLKRCLYLVKFTADFDAGAVSDGFSFLTGAEQDLVALLRAGDVPVREVFAFADFQNVKAFFDEAGTELPYLFKFTVGIDDHPDVLGRAVCSDTKVICHCQISF